MEKFLRVFLRLTVVIMSFFFGGKAVELGERVLHQLVPPFDFSSIEGASWADKVAIIDSYTASHWFAFPSVVLGHALAPFISILIFVLLNRLLHSFLPEKPSLLRQSLIIISVWLIIDLIMDLVFVPVGPLLAFVDAATSFLFGILAYYIAASKRKTVDSNI